MFTSEKHHRKSSFQLIKQDDKFFSKLLSKELNNTDDSFRVDNDGLSGGSVPFFWESRPGTPKHRFDETSIPPLTPPPSYFLKASCGKKWSPSPAKKLLSSKSNFLRILFLKGRGKKSSSPDMPPRSLPILPDDDEDDATVFPPLSSAARTTSGMKLYGQRRSLARDLHRPCLTRA
ncbi:uncharacterized protein LOC116194080 [Punica granatum]|uniref:Uncharacterized protein LOC116194080 n=1 Tax=Punica granatum TaxID=22663 RepID=A0A218X9L6_PUNGR|nr:uncharacterized protein LOC116194080 [Punica granatum]OWM81647.1 hypothetical protein CDL15_Pgr007685 [Punica granatum]